jgi:hypothetical protein
MGSLESDAYQICVKEAMDGAVPQVQSLVASAQARTLYAATTGPKR